jgi:hypothetical protein
MEEFRGFFRFRDRERKNPLHPSTLAFSSDTLPFTSAPHSEKNFGKLLLFQKVIFMGYGKLHGYLKWLCAKK